MKILIATPLFSPEIPEPAQYVNKISYSLEKENAIHIISYGKKGSQINNNAITVIPKDKAVLVRMFLFFWAVLNQAKHYDIIFIQDAVAVGLPTILAAKISRTKTVVRLIEDEPWKRSTQLGLTKLPLEAFLKKPIKSHFIKLIGTVQWFVLKFSDSVLVSSNYIKDIISQTYKLNKQKLHTLYTPIQTPPILPFSSPTNPYHISLYTNLGTENSLKKILHSLKTLQSKFPSIHLHIMDANITETTCAEINMNDINYTIHRYTSDAEFWHIIASSSMYIHDVADTSTYNHILSAILLKTPIITFDSQVAKELFENYHSFPFTNISEQVPLTEIIQTIIANKTQKGQVILDTIILSKKFSLLTHVSQLYSILKNSQAKR